MSSVGDDKESNSLLGMLCGELRDKGKQKKWHKKAEKGEIRSSAQYAIASLLCGVPGKPAIRYVPDKTREKSEHDLHLHEVRDFIQSLLMEEAVPRYFYTENQGYLRYVLHIHIAESTQEDQLLQSLGEEVAGKTYKLRVSRNTQNEDMECLANKLLTLPLDQCDTDEILHHFCPHVSAANKPVVDEAAVTTTSEDTEKEKKNAEDKQGSIYDYVFKYRLSLSLLKMWNYPLLATCFKDELSPNEEELDETPPAAKRARLDDGSSGSINGRSELVGFVIGPTLQDEALCKAVNELSPVAACYYKDFPRNPQLQLHDTQHAHKFFETLPSSGETFQAMNQLLWKNYRVVRVAALDCEMVENVAGELVIARVSLVDADHFYCEGKEDNQDVLLDVLVKPSDIVKDYRTSYSGITSDLLRDVNVSLKDVQALLLALIASDTVLIGHSLENDLKALGIVHTNCVDTSILYPHVRGYPLRQKLKHLAKDYLQLDIQNHSSKKQKGGKAVIGHDSIEDARTALQLVLRKVEGGPLFGILAADGSDPHHRRLPLLSRLSYFNSKHSPEKDIVQSMLLHQKDEGNIYNVDTCVSGAEDTSSSSVGKQRFLSHPDLQQLLSTATAFLHDHRSTPVDVTAHCSTSLGDAMKQSLAPLRFVSLVVTDKAVTAQTIRDIVQHFKQAATTSTSAVVPESGALILTTQPSLQKIRDLQEKRRLCMNLGSRASMCTSLWSSEQEMALKYALKTSLMGHVSFSTL